MCEKKGIVKEPTRESELEAWFARHRVRKSDAAKILGISSQRLGQLIRGIYLTPEWRVKLITVVGIPERLLPHAQEYR